jgi:hypothetical protein
MATQYYNRYSNFLVNGEQTVVPYLNLQPKGSDKKYIYRVGQSRLDKISEQYYGSPFFGWLILQANPEFSGSEFEIPDGTVLTIPYPLVTSLQEYKSTLDNYRFYYCK